MLTDAKTTLGRTAVRLGNAQMDFEEYAVEQDDDNNQPEKIDTASRATVAVAA